MRSANKGSKEVLVSGRRAGRNTRIPGGCVRREPCFEPALGQTPRALQTPRELFLNGLLGNFYSPKPSYNLLLSNGFTLHGFPSRSNGKKTRAPCRERPPMELQSLI